MGIYNGCDAHFHSIVASLVSAQDFLMTIDAA